MIDIETFKNLALSFPETVELPHFEKTSFRIKNKIFATLDTNYLKACLKLTETDQSVFCAIDKTIIYPVNNKWGKQGWTFVELQQVKKTILKDILSKAYTSVAPMKMNAKNKL
ncbi:MAG: MmcQ/YjbR family DNA-binding protein [Ferruginibacter sp.]|nr:MmcQ/YjbR family DNA-binding protein [Ferruginibacter sp.]